MRHERVRDDRCSTELRTRLQTLQCVLLRQGQGDSWIAARLPDRLHMGGFEGVAYVCLKNLAD